MPLMFLQERLRGISVSLDDEIPDEGVRVLAADNTDMELHSAPRKANGQLNRCWPTLAL
jgi:hypothetical protein